jgi:DNA polymerase III delta subunit
MKYREALSNLKFRREKNFALMGEEPYLKEAFIQTAQKTYSEYELAIFDPWQEAEALDILSSGSLFSKFLVILRDFGEMEVSKFEEPIKAVDGCLIMVFGEKLDLKSRAVTKVLGHATLVECEKLKEYGQDYPIWIQTHVADAGYEIQNGADDLIFSKIGPNLFPMALELEKLFLMKSNKRILVEDVNRYVSLTAVSTAYDLFDSILRRDVKSALQSFDSYSKTQDNFIDIITFIGKYLEKMYRILLLREEKMSDNDVAEIIGIPLFLLKKKYLPRLSNLGKNFIASKIDSLCRLDVQLRVFRGDKKILFDRFILSFSQ